MFFQKWKSKNIPKVKQKLTIVQDEDKIVINGLLSEHYEAKELWMKPREIDTEDVKLAEIKPASSFEFQVDWKKLFSKFQDLEPKVYDCYLKVRVPVENVEEKTLEKLKDQAEFYNEDGIEIAEYFIRLGRFEHMVHKNDNMYTAGTKTGVFYLTKKGNLSFNYNSEPIASAQTQIEKIVNKGNTMFIKGRIFTRNSKILSGEGIVRGRNHNQDYKVKASFLHLEEETSEKYGLNRYSYVMECPLESLVNDQLEDDVYDFYVNLQFHDQSEEKLIRVGRPTTRVKLFRKEHYAKKGNIVAVMNPYFTFKASNLSLEVYNFPLDTYQVLKQKMRWAKVLRVFDKKKDVWIVGERTYKAQDTGYHFFKYMRENHPEKEVYYVIEKDSPEAKNVEPLGNVLYFKSKEHIMKTLVATRVISSHHPDYLYPMRTRSFMKKVKALQVFLQHGVMGTKNMVANYGKNAPAGFHTDLFLVSSDFEKNMIVTDFGYDENEVFVTGLSRFDKLFEKDVEVKRQLLIIPTWRDWITSDDVFLESEYFDRYRAADSSSTFT